MVRVRKSCLMALQKCLLFYPPGGGKTVVMFRCGLCRVWFMDLFGFIWFGFCLELIILFFIEEIYVVIYIVSLKLYLLVFLNF